MPRAGGAPDKGRALTKAPRGTQGRGALLALCLRVTLHLLVGKRSAAPTFTPICLEAATFRACEQKTLPSCWPPLS